MDNALFVGLSRQLTLRRELDIVANNIANVDTVGFKLENLMVETQAQRPAVTTPGPKPVKFVMDRSVGRDFGQGGLQTTGAAFDLAVEGPGFFKVGSPDGERYTRDGRFTLDNTGRLVTQAGNPVLGSGGEEILIDPIRGAVNIAADGTISQGLEQVGKIGVASFPELAVLEKTGDNLYRNTSNAQPEVAADSKVRQGMLENSNVKPIVEIGRMIEITRAYESVAKMMDSTSELSRRSIERMGKVQ